MQTDRGINIQPQLFDSRCGLRHQVCQMISSGGQVHDDPEQHVRYVTRGDQWVGIEDEKSITEKVRVWSVTG